MLSADPAAFPAEPPASLNDPVTIAAHDWAAFSALDEMIDHWSRPGWSDGTRAYYWLLTFPDAPALIDLAQRCQKALECFCLDPVPAHGLHITLTRVGGPDALTHRQLETLANNAADALPGAFSLRAMPLAGSRGAVRLSVGPWEPLVRLHAALLEAGQRVGFASKKPTSVFRPHLSLAYNNRRRPAAPLTEAIAPLRSLHAVDLDVAEVQLVELRRCGAEYRWDVVESVPLMAPDLIGGSAG
ncbi:2'-5' RNA ligase family protein [Streptomyces sp. 7N604]|uniref:2'-5' RNA ligase family protein n=1 Tax=Streptomyces sp. 7N604 TaxID=3457415 RepID=UPI003FD3B629